jgi:hypothetical protein
MRRDRVHELSNSRPLSHWIVLMVEPNYVDTYEKKLDKVVKVLDFNRNGKVHK